jgi:uncharacterized repeat protein (TIGR02543 family)
MTWAPIKERGACLMKKIFFILFMVVFLTLVGCTKEQTVKVTFDTNGGTSIAEMSAIDDILSGIPQTTKAGYTFSGWYENESLTESFDPLKERESWVITLYAKWTANNKDYTVEHYKENLEGVYELFEEEDLSGVTDQNVTATPKSYEGFSINTSHESATPTMQLPASGDATLKLYYQRNTYNVIIDEAGGNAVDNLLVKYGQTITLPTVTRFGYTFVAWSSYPSTMPANDVTVTASWLELPQYDVVFDEKGGSTVTDQTIYQGYVATAPANPSRIGYAFSGWFIDLEGTQFNFSTPITSDITLNAKWTPIEVNYTVEYYTENLSGTYISHHSAILQALTESTVTATASNIPGFTENNLHLNRIPSGTVLADGSLVLKLYYDRNTYSISFESNANLSIQSISALYEAAISQPQDPIRSGYTFIGWYSDQTLTQTYTFNTMPLDGITLYAKWLGQPTNLYFNSNGGSEVAMITAQLDGVISAPSAPAKLGYTFDGWYKDQMLTEAFTTWVMPSGGITLYAKWDANPYTISFVENGGSAVSDITQDYLTSVVAPTSPTKTDYIFVGWYSDLELQTAYTFDTMPLNGITLYAKWISEEEGLSLSHMLTMDNYTSVHVKGKVLMISEDPYVGFYLADGTNYIYVHYDQDLVTVGNSYEFDAILIFTNEIPALYHVSDVLDITNTYVLPTPLIKTVEDIKTLDVTQRLFVDVTGILKNDTNDYQLLSMIDGMGIRIADQFSLGDTTLMINNKVNLKGVLHYYDNEWVLASYEITTIGLTDLEKADLIKNYIDFYYPDSYESMDMFSYLSSDPWGFGSIDMVLDTEDEAYYDAVNHQFVEVTTTETLHYTITISINSTTYNHELNLSLLPRHYDTISDVIDGTLGDIYNIQGLVVMANYDQDVYVLKDSTGEIFILGDLNVNYGDLISVEIMAQAMSHMIYGEYNLPYYLNVVSSNHELNNLPTVMNLTDIETLTFNDAHQYGDYIEIKGFLNGPNETDMHDQFFLTNDTYQFFITPVGYQAYEVLYEFDGLEVMIRGYLALNEEGIPMLVFTGQRRDVYIPNYTDEERVEMILTLFSKTYAGYEFKSYETFMMLPYHPVLGGQITWNFIEGGQYYDPEYQWFTYAGEVVTIKIEMTISYGAVSRTYIYQTTLDATHALTIEQFKNIGWYNEGFVEGVVVYRCPERLYIQDETGMLLVDVYEVDAYKGDRVILYGQLMTDYQYQQNDYLYYYRNYGSKETPLVVKIIERDLTDEILFETKELSEVVTMDPDLESSYSQYIQTDGYLTFDGWYFRLLKGEYAITFEAIDEYTMHQLASWQDTHVSIKLMVEGFDDPSWEFIYLGIDGDVSAKSYSLSDKQGVVTGYIDSIWSTPIISGSSRTLPSAYSPFEASYAYSIPEAYQSTFDLNSGYIYSVSEAVTIPLTVTITVDSVAIEHVINVQVLPANTTSTVTILDAKNMLDTPVTIEAVIYATFTYDYNEYGLIANDGTDDVIVYLGDMVYFYGGNEIGKTAVINGVMSYEQGRYTFNATSFKTINFEGAPSLVATPMPIETFVTLDHSQDQYLGDFVEITGTIERVGWDHYEIISGYHHIRIQTVYYGESSVSPFVGFEATVKGFILGQSTFENSDDLTLVIGHASYDGMLNVQLSETDDEVIAQKLVHYFIGNRYDPIYLEGEYIQLANQHELFPTAVVTYEVLTYPLLLENLGTQLLVKHSDVDVVATIRLSVTYGTATVTHDFEVEIDGYTLNTLDDLFDETVPFDEIYLEATVIVSEFNYSYFLINGDIYYHHGHLGVYDDKGSVVVIHGKKSIIDGEMNYSYNVEYQNLQSYNEVTLVPRSMTIAELYTADLSVDDIRRDYLTVYGKLGYDQYLDYFYLDDLGKRIYIRTQLSSYEPYSMDYQILKMPTMNLEVFMEYVDDYVYINVLFPNQKVLADYLLVDFIGNDQDIWIPEWTQAEKVNITKEKLVARLDGNEYTSGDYIQFMTMDSVQATWIEYSLVNPLQEGILLDTWDSMALLVDERTAVQLLATISHYDELTENDYSDTVNITIYINPITSSTIREVLFGNVGQYYRTKGIIQYVYEDYYIIIKDETGLLYVEIPDDTSLSMSLAVGDEVEVLGERATFEMMDYVPVMDYAIDVKILSTGHAVTQTPITVSIDDILEIDYLDPDSFNQYISFTGTVIFSGNTWYPSFDLREDGYMDNTYDLQLWGNTYDEFNTDMGPRVGDVIRVEGYLIGFEYIYGEFDWQLKVTTVEVIIP